MTSKEALEMLINDYNNVVGNYVMNNYSKEINIIKQNLDRLEKLEKVIKLIKDKNVQIYDLLNSSSVERYNSLSWSTYDFDGLDLDKQEYELLKEVLENVK